VVETIDTGDDTYRDSLYLIHDGEGRYYGWLARPSRRFAGRLGFTNRQQALEFCEFSHPRAAAKAQLEKETGRRMFIERSGKGDDDERDDGDCINAAVAT
jgi:hypothetical protein